jgi:hypothetical protein
MPTPSACAMLNCDGVSMPSAVTVACVWSAKLVSAAASARVL